MTTIAQEEGPPVAPETHRRRWVSVLVWLTAAPFAIWAVLRLVPADVHFRWVQLVGFTPYVAMLSVVAPIVALVSRRWKALAASLLVTAMLSACVLPRATVTDVDDGGPSLRILSSNLMIGAAPPPALVDLVRRLRPDVLTLQELTPEAAEGLDEAGLGALLPYKVVRSRPGTGGSGIYARFPLTPGQAIDIGGFGQARATLAAPDGRPVEIVSVHPCAPRYQNRYQCWADGLAALAAPAGSRRVLAGDFNATLDHARVRRLLDEGYSDAADATGDGLSTTWPYRPWHFNGFGIPPVTLDHVLAGPGVTVRAFSVQAVPDTDHRAVFAELGLTAG
ncbi:endonuclease/exonuclease/phosphatase family protein [Planotetraspora kaengkrachanensis]|uniref:Endonuclease n=1 Tax=Planotetraspora kaengkrachanensis TaxID=575193 RepID=A0A8J3VCL4_9ACTN|nr:endonuclease/exonuclease/phosphatase family protein [Planotetraspora kaengkrachanensis]GIG84883.1 endonuclease [Planotetraspora kaengkrachanensis]